MCHQAKTDKNASSKKWKSKSLLGNLGGLGKCLRKQRGGGVPDAYGRRGGGHMHSGYNMYIRSKFNFAKFLLILMYNYLGSQNIYTFGGLGSSDERKLSSEYVFFIMRQKMVIFVYFFSKFDGWLLRNDQKYVRKVLFKLKTKAILKHSKNSSKSLKNVMR